MEVRERIETFLERLMCLAALNLAPWSIWRLSEAETQLSLSVWCLLRIFCLPAFHKHMFFFLACLFFLWLIRFDSRASNIACLDWRGHTARWLWEGSGGRNLSTYIYISLRDPGKTLAYMVKREVTLPLFTKSHIICPFLNIMKRYKDIYCVQCLRRRIYACMLLHWRQTGLLIEHWRK